MYKFMIAEQHKASDDMKSIDLADTKLASTFEKAGLRNTRSELTVKFLPWL